MLGLSGFIPDRFTSLVWDAPIPCDLGLRLRLGLVLRLGLGHGEGCVAVRQRRDVTQNPTPHHYDSPGAVRCPPRPPHSLSALRLRPQAQAADRTRSAALRRTADRCALRHCSPGAEVEDPRQHRRLPRHRARAGVAGPHGQPLVGAQCQHGDPAAGRPAQRDRLRGHRPLGSRAGQGSGGLGRAGRAALRPHLARRALLTRPGAIPLPAAAGGGHLPGGAPVLLADLRHTPVGARRQPGVPADRVLEDPPVHLLRLVLRRERGMLCHPDGADQGTASTSTPGR